MMTQGAGLKCCGHCNQFKPLNEFYKRRASQSGLQSWCKECVKINSGKYRNRELDNIRRKNEYNKHKKFVITLLPNKCFFDGPYCHKRKQKGKEHACTLHEKNGNGHDRGAVDILYYNPKRAKEFVRLCHIHHLMVHYIMRLSGHSWDEIAYFLKGECIKYTEV